MGIGDSTETRKVMIAKLSFLRYVCLYIMFKIQVPQREVLKRDLKQGIAALLSVLSVGGQSFNRFLYNIFRAKFILHYLNNKWNGNRRFH